MIRQTIAEIEERLRKAETIKDENKAELIGLLATLKSEIEQLSRTHGEQAQSIAGFTNVSTHEAKPAKGSFAQEYDLVGVRNGRHGEVFWVEIKSELNAEELEKSLKKFQEFFDWFPQYRGMKLYGIISAVDVRGALADRVHHAGLYLATASDENFKLAKPPRGFRPKVFTAK
jgi:hypothetical protein